MRFACTGKMSLILIFFMAFPLYADLSKTPAECAERYGKPVCEAKKGNLDFFTYIKNNYLISIIYDSNGKAVSITYSKPDIKNEFYEQSRKAGKWEDIVQYSKDFNKPLDMIEINRFLEINSGEGKWTELIDDKFWRRNDGAEAMYNTKTGKFSVMTESYIKNLQEDTGKEKVGF